jgi:hypothetical protein
VQIQRLVPVVAGGNAGKLERVWVQVECILPLASRIDDRIGRFLLVGFRIFYSKAMNATSALG